MASSSPTRHAPNDSPRSLLRSIAGRMLPFCRCRAQTGARRRDGCARRRLTAPATACGPARRPRQAAVAGRALAACIPARDAPPAVAAAVDSSTRRPTRRRPRPCPSSHRRYCCRPGAPDVLATGLDRAVVDPPRPGRRRARQRTRFRAHRRGARPTVAASRRRAGRRRPRRRGRAARARVPAAHLDGRAVRLRLLHGGIRQSNRSDAPLRRPGELELGAPHAILDRHPARRQPQRRPHRVRSRRMLYATVGDAGNATPRRTRRRCRGKILRMTPRAMPARQSVRDRLV